MVYCSLNAKEHEQLLKKQYRQLWKRQFQLVKKIEKSLHFTLPITYRCPMKSKRKQTSSIISNSSQSYFSLFQQPSSRRKLNNQFSTKTNRLKSAVNISFIDDKSHETSINKIPNEIHSSSLLNIPSRNISTHKIHSLNANVEKASMSIM
ncbi:unnamed protein product [Rotaria magnacalcarata]|uniref:Uncharacterized protein n=1 Tax=Rotaria magnacalcarata TaxID=392030 RepID=A0A816Y911_9BILA|nr:unnamed protein product [Rotaria magnacalcarata]